MSLTLGQDRFVIDGWPLDRILALLGIGLAILLLPLRLFVSSIFVQTIPIVIGVGSGFYYLGQRQAHQPSRVAIDVSASMAHVLRLLVVVGLGAMLFTAAATGGRTPLFFGVAAAVSTLLVAHILFAPESALRPQVVLAQILGFGVVLRGVALLATPGLIGIDVWVHLYQFAGALQQTGQLSAISNTIYYGAPLHHLLVVVAAAAFGSSLKTALYATLGIAMPLSMLLVYYVSSRLLPVRWALFATAVFSIADHVVRWGIHLIPTSLGLVFFVGVFYGVSRIYAGDATRESYALVLVLGVATVLTHQISTFILLVFLAAGALAQLGMRILATRAGPGSWIERGRTVNFAFVLACLLPLTLLDWSVSPPGGGFLPGMVGNAEASLAAAGFLNLASVTPVDTTPIQSLLVSTPIAVQLVDTLGFLTLLFAVIVGALAVLNRRRLDVVTATLILATVAMLVVTEGLPLFGQYFLIPVRWYAFMYAPMAVLAGYGVWYLEQTLSARQLVAVLVVFALLFSVPMLVNHKATPDRPIAPTSYDQYAFSAPELAAASTISSIHPPGQVLSTDKTYSLLFRNWQQVPRRNLALVSLDDGGTSSGTSVVYRRYESTYSSVMTYRDANVRVQVPADAVCRPEMNVVYSNGDVEYCVTT